ncbi:MAG: PorT family protein [Tannerella sp.]|nr:PorT family protein [Tannerella sp.]
MKRKTKYGIWVVMALLCFPLCCFQAQGKLPGWDFRINGGFNIGGTSPLPLPAEIRKISFSPPALSPHVALEAIRRLNDRWGVSAQLALDYKGFEVEDQVKNLYTEIEMDNEMYTGNFTGKNTTRIHNSYFTLPVMATYRMSERWEVQAGMYAAYLYSANFKGSASDGYIRQGSPVGEKTMVDYASFDFSDKQRPFDYGLLVAGEWGFSRRFAVRGQIAWGLNPVFPSDFTGIPFKMYHIYGTLGLSYHLTAR